MARYLEQFYKKIAKKWKGSLVRVKDIEKIDPNAKEYLNKLARAGLIERVKWGWYWIPDEIEDIWGFLVKDKNFKAVSSQTAASLYNYDFVHRDVYFLRVRDRSFGRALEEFSRRRGWNVEVEYEDPSRPSKVKYKKIGNLFVSSIEDTIIDCMQNWAFIDAFATLYANRDGIKIEKLAREGYWKRISGTDVRVRQALEYGCHEANELSGEELFPVRGSGIADGFVKRGIDEAVGRVVELG